jgi:hypothetical protein
MGMNTQSSQDCSKFNSSILPNHTGSEPEFDLFGAVPACVNVNGGLEAQ